MAEKRIVSRHDVSRLLHNKFVVVLGDSIQRGVYKDLVLLLQKDKFLGEPQLRAKGEMSFETDRLVEGGRLEHMTNGTEYREVRQFRSAHHLVRFYFATRIFSSYMQSILEDFRTGIKPDLVVVNSCVWDISRYGADWDATYRENLNRFFEELKSVLLPECLVVWNVTMPLGKKIHGGFLTPEIAHMGPTLRYDVIEANFYSAKLANAYGLDVLDLHYHFRYSLQHRTKDGVHWNQLAHRRITCLLLHHAAEAWGVDLPSPILNIDKIAGKQQQVSRSIKRPVSWEAPPPGFCHLVPKPAVQPYDPDAYIDDLPPALGYFSFEGSSGSVSQPRHRQTHREEEPYRCSTGPYVMRNKNTRKYYEPPYSQYSRERQYHPYNHPHPYHPHPYHPHPYHR